MTVHVDHQMHEHSLDAWAAFIASGMKARRELLVFWHIFYHPGKTDHECQADLGFKERNNVSPTISRFVKRGIFKEGPKVTVDGRKRRTTYVPADPPLPPDTLVAEGGPMLSMVDDPQLSLL